MILLLDKRGSWYNLLAKINHLYIENVREAISVCRKALDSIESFSMKYRRSIQKRLDGIQNNTSKECLWNHEYIYAKKVDRGGAHGKALYVDEETNEMIHVEEFAVRYYTRQGWKAVHSENSSLTGIVNLNFIN